MKPSDNTFEKNPENTPANAHSDGNVDAGFAQDAVAGINQSLNQSLNTELDGDSHQHQNEDDFWAAPQTSRPAALKVPLPPKVQAPQPEPTLDLQDDNQTLASTEPDAMDEDLPELDASAFEALSSESMPESESESGSGLDADVGGAGSDRGEIERAQHLAEETNDTSDIHDISQINDNNDTDNIYDSDDNNDIDEGGESDDAFDSDSPAARPMSFRAAVESMLFASGEALSVRELVSLFEGLPEDVQEELLRTDTSSAGLDDVESAEHVDENQGLTLAARIKRAIKAIQEDVNHDSQRGFRLLKIGRGYVFRTHETYGTLVRERMQAKPMRLSKPALETLAIVAYRQPVTKADVDQIRGVDCSGTLRQLLDREIIRIVGKRDEPGRPLIYGTGDDFLSLFNLSSLRDLPALQEFTELGDDAQKELADFDGLDLEGLQAEASAIAEGDDSALEELQEAMQGLKTKAKETSGALEDQGISLDDDEMEI